MSLFVDLNINEVDAIHADLLRRAEHPELARSPHDELVLVGDRGGEATSCLKIFSTV